MSKIKKAAKYALKIPRNLFYREFLKPLPIQIFNFEVTRRCQSRCLTCNMYNTQSKVESEFSPSEVRDYFKPLSLFGKVGVVALTGGEPTLRKDLVDLILAVKEMCPNAKVSFPTNCLNPNLIAIVERIVREAEPDLSLGLSLDGFEKTNDYQRGVTGHFKRVMEVAEKLKEMNVPFGIGSTVTTRNLEELSEFRSWLLKQGIPHSFDVATESTSYYKNEGKLGKLSIIDSPKRKYYASLLRDLAKIGPYNDYRFLLPKYVLKQKQVIPCFSCYSSFFLNCYGEVYPCIHLDRKLGSLRESSFKDIWFGAEAKEARKLIRSGKCHCWTSCECKTALKNLVYPSLIGRAQNRLSGGQKVVC